MDEIEIQLIIMDDMVMVTFVFVQPGERRNLELGQTESSGYTIRNGAV